MVRKPVQYRRRPRLSLVALALLIGTGAAAQPRPSAWTELQPDDPVVNQAFQFIVHVTSYDAGAVRALPPDWPLAVQVVSGPAVTTRSRSELTFSYTLRVRTAGRHTVPPLVLRVGQQGLTTRPVSFEVQAAATQRAVKPRLIWEVLSPKPWYVGQTVGLQLTLESFGEIPVPQEVTVRPPSGARLDEGTFAARLRSQLVVAEGGGQVQRLLTPVATYALTLQRESSVVHPARVVADGVELFSEQVRLRAIAPPEGILPGAIGSFDVDLKVSPAVVAVGQVVSVEVRVSGVGSLPALPIPEVQHPGLELIEAIRTEEVSLTEVGFVGSVVHTLTLRVDQSGILPVSVLGFTFFDPLRDLVGQVAARSTAVQAEPAGVDGEAGPITLPRFLQPRPGACRRIYQVPLAYALFAIGPFACIAVLLRRWRNPRRALLAVAVFLLSGVGPASSQDATELASLYATGEYVTVLNGLSALRAQDDGCLRHLAYDEGLVFHQLGQDDRSIQRLRIAIANDPRDTTARRALKAVERRLGLTAQPPPLPTASPSALFIAMSVALGLSGLAFAYFLMARRAGTLLVATLCLMAFLGVGGWFAATLIGQRQPQVVVRAQAESLRRIPEAGATKWLALSEGSVLMVRDSFDQYLLVETGYGLMGWLHRESVLELSVPGK